MPEIKISLKLDTCQPHVGHKFNLNFKCLKRLTKLFLRHQRQLTKTQVGPHNSTKPLKHENKATQPHQISQTCKIANYPGMLLHQTPQVRKEIMSHTLMLEEISTTIFIFTKGFHSNKENRTNMKITHIYIILLNIRISWISTTQSTCSLLGTN